MKIMPKEKKIHYQTPNEKPYTFFDPDVDDATEQLLKRNMKRKGKKYNKRSKKGCE